MDRTQQNSFRRIDESIEFDVAAAQLDFALELKRLMDEREVKKTDLADILQVSKPMITKLLRGDSNLTIETMVKASRALSGKLLVRIVRANCTPRVFEIAKVEAARARINHKNIRNIKAPSHDYVCDWNVLSANQESIQANETKSIAA